VNEKKLLLPCGMSGKVMRGVDGTKKNENVVLHYDSCKN
jgi:hypothetical protein